MNDKDVVKMYKKGYSIDFIVDRFYRDFKRETKVINARHKKIILIENDINKGKIRHSVYEILYKFNKKNDTRV